MSARDDLVYRITRHVSAEIAEHLNDVLTRLASEIRALPAERGEQR